MWYITIRKKIGSDPKNTAYVQVALTDREVESAKVDVLTSAVERAVKTLQAILKEKAK
jgi:hypothetical protein